MCLKRAQRLLTKRGALLTLGGLEQLSALRPKRPVVPKTGLVEPPDYLPGVSLVARAFCLLEVAPTDPY
jgi:hypothetical protein